MKKELKLFRDELKQELEEILAWWETCAVDHTQGGFYGKIAHNNKVTETAPKGSVLNSRILWTFSSAANATGNNRLLAVAHRAYFAVSHNFSDPLYGGVYWSIQPNKTPLETKKQVYAQAFAIYALSEYARCTNNEKALQQAIDMYLLVLRYSFDRSTGGYLEALSREWKEQGDLRLSEKDANEKKTMNTHLHLVEAFSALYRVWPNEELREKTAELLRLFLDTIIHPTHHHLQLFFDENWRVKSDLISYGHDIEAAWLLLEAAETIHHPLLVKEIQQRSVLMAEAALEGMDSDGGLWYEYDPSNAHLVREKHWWPQAEAMVGFFQAWELTGDDKFLQIVLKNWEFIKFHLKHPQGEWIWGIRDDYSAMEQEDKAGLWKCPYHNGRACMELIKRINKIEP